MQSKAKTVDQYLGELPDDRREALQVVRAVVLKNLPKGYEEGMQYGMIGYFVPHSVVPTRLPLRPQATSALRRSRVAETPYVDLPHVHLWR